jgi:hypothetical protein
MGFMGQDLQDGTGFTENWSSESFLILLNLGFAQKVLVLGFLCATSVFSVSLWCVLLGIHQPQRHREHRDCTEKSAIVTFCAKPSILQILSIVDLSIKNQRAVRNPFCGATRLRRRRYRPAS